MKKICFCGEITPIATDIHIVLLMHPMEAKRERTGTGRLASLCISQSEIVVGVDFTTDKRVNQLVADPLNASFVLYPGEMSINISLEKNRSLISQLKKDSVEGRKKLVLFLIDGTWPCAKKMMRLSRNLQILPRLCFTPDRPSQFIIKQQPHELCLSTIEAIHFFLHEWDNEGREKNMKDQLLDPYRILMDVFRRQVKHQIDCANNPEINHYRDRKGPYKDPKDRIPAKKWEKRSIFYSGFVS